MIRPTPEVLDAVAPPHSIDELRVVDAGPRNVAHSELHDTLRVPRGGLYSATLVAVRKTYDGANGGEAGPYLLAFVEFKPPTGSRWRTSGVKIRPIEAKRIARDMIKAKPSKPARSETIRVGGKIIARADSELRGVPLESGSYLVYVRCVDRGGDWVRTRGVEVLPIERDTFAKVLAQLAATLPKPKPKAKKTAKKRKRA